MDIMVIFLIVCAIIEIILLLLSWNHNKRNWDVHDYKMNLLERVYDSRDYYRWKYNTSYLDRMHDEIVSIPYDKMLFKFWLPLKDKYWLSKEQIDFLNHTL